jgi:hypothetical protein
MRFFAAMFIPPLFHDDDAHSTHSILAFSGLPELTRVKHIVRNSMLMLDLIVSAGDRASSQRENATGA